MAVVSTTFKLKRGTAARWQELNLVLQAGEPGVELDTLRLKIGDGDTAWNDLPYISDVRAAATRAEFPAIGDSRLIYKANNEKTLYQWNETLGAYEVLGASGGEGGITVDTELSSTSLNPIANKAVAEAISKLNYIFGEGFIVKEVDGKTYVKLDATFTPEIDTTGFVTDEELETAISEIQIPIKLSEFENDTKFITIEDVENKGYLTSIPDDYAKKNDIPSLEGLATESYVQTEIGKIQIPEVDLSNYYTKQEVDSKDEGLKTYIDEEISKAVIGGEVDLSAYAKTSYVNEQLELKVDKTTLETFTPAAIAYGEF